MNETEIINNAPYPGVEEETQALTKLVKEIQQPETQASQPEPEPQQAQASEPEPEVIERFDVETESKLLKAFLKVFTESDNIVSEEKLLEIETPGVVDPAHVCMVVAKTTRAKLVIRRFFDGQCKVPDLTNTLNQSGNSMIAIDYFLNILKIIDVVSDHFRIREGTDSPGIIESEDFKFLLAPRIESE